MTKSQAAALIEKNLKTVYAWAYSRVSDKYDAEDLAGDIIEKAVGSAEKLRDDRAFYGWFWQLAANTYKSYLTVKKRQTLGELGEPSEWDAYNEIFPDENTERLRREIAFLGKNHRNCTVDYYFNDLSVKEIAKKHSLTTDMVKYYLFKTRKILKEGIAMERQFGEKSFNPANITLTALTEGVWSNELSNLLFNRKLPGQIVSSAYYTPATLEELSFELGIPTVYLEDEVNLLCEYGILKKQSSGKFRSNIIIIDNIFLEKYYKRICDECREPLTKMCEGIKKKFPEIRKTDFGNPDYPDALILWNTLVYVIVEGYFTAQCINFSDAPLRLKSELSMFVYAVSTDKKELGLKYNLQHSCAAAWGSEMSNVPVDENFKGSCAYFATKSFSNEELRETLESYKKNGFPSAIYSLEDSKNFVELMCPEVPLCSDAIHIANKIGMEIAEDTAPEGIAVSENCINGLLMHETREALLNFAADFCGFSCPDTPFAGAYFYIYNS